MALRAAKTIPALLQARAALSPDGTATRWHQDGHDRTQTWSELWYAVQITAATWCGQGLRPGLRIAIVGGNSRAWDVAHYAVVSAGAIVVGLDERLSDTHLIAAMHASRIHGFVTDGHRRAALARAFADAPVFTAALESVTSGVPTTGAVASIAPVAHDATATLITTSGTTGDPKRIAFTHAQLLVACQALADALGDTLEQGSTVAWMPLTHLFQRMLNLVAIRCGASIAYCDDPRQLTQSLSRYAPTLLAGVPRFFEKLEQALDAAIAAQPRWRQALLPWALRVGSTHRRANRLVLEPLRTAIAGKHIRCLLTGSAPTPPRLVERFQAIGLPLLEAYGTSENTVPIALNTPRAQRLGSVGRVLAPNEVSLSPEGEVLVRGPGLFRGYEDEVGTSTACWQEDGAYRTGDLGRFDADGYLFLRGRCRELIKTSTGRRIAPLPIETSIRAIPGIDYAIVVGDGFPFLLGLLSLDPARSATLLPSLPEALGQVVEPLPAHLQVRTWVVLDPPLTPQRGELTASGKLRRDRIVQTRAHEIAIGAAAAREGAEVSAPSPAASTAQVESGAGSRTRPPLPPIRICLASTP